MSIRKKTVLAVLGVGAMLITTGAARYAGHNSLTSGTVVTIAGGLHFEEDIDGVQVDVTCTSFVAKAVVGGAANLHFASSPAITGCTDSLAGTDTITTSGTWYLHAGPPMKLAIPTAGATFSSNAIPGCVVTWAPASVMLKGHYNSVNTEQITD